MPFAKSSVRIGCMSHTASSRFFPKTWLKSCCGPGEVYSSRQARPRQAGKMLAQHAFTDREGQQLAARCAGANARSGAQGRSLIMPPIPRAGRLEQEAVICKVRPAGRVQEVRSMPEQLLIPQAEACRRLGISRPTLVAEIEAGRLRYVLVGKRRKFKPSDLECYIERQGRGCDESGVWSPNVKVHPTITKISRLRAIDFDEALRLTSGKLRRS